MAITGCTTDYNGEKAFKFMKKFLEYLISLIIDHPKDLKIEERQIGDTSYQYIVNGHSEDIGKIIGKQGKIIQAIRNVAIILAIKENKQINIEIT